MKVFPCNQSLLFRYYRTDQSPVRSQCSGVCGGLSDEGRAGPGYYGETDRPEPAWDLPGSSVNITHHHTVTHSDTTLTLTLTPVSGSDTMSDRIIEER